MPNLFLDTAITQCSSFNIIKFFSSGFQGFRGTGFPPPLLSFSCAFHVCSTLQLENLQSIIYFPVILGSITLWEQLKYVIHYYRYNDFNGSGMIPTHVLFVYVHTFEGILNCCKRNFCVCVCLAILPQALMKIAEHFQCVHWLLCDSYLNNPFPSAFHNASTTLLFSPGVNAWTLFAPLHTLNDLPFSPWPCYCLG